MIYLFVSRFIATFSSSRFSYSSLSSLSGILSVIATCFVFLFFYRFYECYARKKGDKLRGASAAAIVGSGLLALEKVIIYLAVIQIISFDVLFLNLPITILGTLLLVSFFRDFRAAISSNSSMKRISEFALAGYSLFLVFRLLTVLNFILQSQSDSSLEFLLHTGNVIVILGFGLTLSFYISFYRNLKTS